MKSKLLIIDVAGLGYELATKSGYQNISGIGLSPIESVFPAVTCTVQASFRTASRPESHGMVSNGIYFRELGKVMFWEQSAGLVAGPRIWEPLREAGRRVGMFFWQQSLGESVDMVLSPAPVHTHCGGMITGCLSRPAHLEDNLNDSIGRKFPLHRYWGPLASAKVGDWIAGAVSALLSEDTAPELMLVYLPSLDYDLQRHGPSHRKTGKALAKTVLQLESMIATARGKNYETVLFGDYTVTPVSGEAVFPNVTLKNAGLLAVRNVRGMEYIDLYHSRAFAVTDHEMAHVYVSRQEDIDKTIEVLSSLEGVLKVEQKTMNHPRAGELLMVASEGRWMAYPWWREKRKAPDFASHMDIHNKPGFDPCELFFSPIPLRICRDTSRISGSHGRIGPGREVAFGATIDAGKPESIIGLASNLSQWIRSEMC